MNKQKIYINFKLSLVFQCVKDEDLVENPIKSNQWLQLAKSVLWVSYGESRYSEIWSSLKVFSVEELEVKQGISLIWHRKCYQDATYSGMLIRAKERYERVLAGPNESQLIERTGYEARQTSKEQTKMPRFVLEGPRPRTITMHELRNQHVSIGQALSSR